MAAEELSGWISRQGWGHNPFTFTVNPDFLVGYQAQAAKLMSAIEEKHKLAMILGPTGSGKTTFMMWLMRQLGQNYDVLYLGKPPKHAEDFVHIFNSKYKRGLLFPKMAKNLYFLPDFLNSCLNRRLVVLYDEAHESGQDVLEWLRVLSDQVEKMTIVIAGLPILDEVLMKNLETLRKRIAVKVELLSLTKEELQQLIQKRVESAGGKALPFSAEMIDYIYKNSGGFPREVLRLCDEAIRRAAAAGIDNITPALLEEKKLAPEETQIRIDLLPEKQRQILEMLIKPMTPSEILASIDVSQYPSKGHALRAVNNILKRLVELGYAERQQAEKTFVYSLSPRTKTLFVKK